MMIRFPRSFTESQRSYEDERGEIIRTILSGGDVTAHLIDENGKCLSTVGLDEKHVETGGRPRLKIPFGQILCDIVKADHVEYMLEREQSTTVGAFPIQPTKVGNGAAITVELEIQFVD